MLIVQRLSLLSGRLIEIKKHCDFDLDDILHKTEYLNNVITYVEDIIDGEPMIKIIIAGGRDFSDYNYLKESVFTVLKQIKNQGFNTSKTNIEIISGNATGADSWGERFSWDHLITLKMFPADWNRLGRKAGILRNIEMADYCVKNAEFSCLIAFHDTISKGTAHMLKTAKSKGIKSKVFKYNTEVK